MPDEISARTHEHHKGDTDSVTRFPTFTAVNTAINRSMRISNLRSPMLPSANLSARRISRTTRRYARYCEVVDVVWTRWSNGDIDIDHDEDIGVDNDAPNRAEKEERDEMSRLSGVRSQLIIP